MSVEITPKPMMKVGGSGGFFRTYLVLSSRTRISATFARSATESTDDVNICSPSCQRKKSFFDEGDLQPTISHSLRFF